MNGSHPELLQAVTDLLPRGQDTGTPPGVAERGQCARRCNTISRCPLRAARYRLSGLDRLHAGTSVDDCFAVGCPV